MATLAPQRPIAPNQNGPTLPASVITPFNAAGGGDQCPMGGYATILSLKNGSGAAITVTFDSVQPSSQGTDVDQSRVIAAGTEEHWVFYAADYPRYSNAADGQLHWSYSGVTSLTGTVRQV